MILKQTLLAIAIMLPGVIKISPCHAQTRQHYIDESVFDDEIAAGIAGSVRGMSYAVGDENGVVFSNGFGLAKTFTDGWPVFFSPKTPVMAASLSKMICTVTTMHILENTYLGGVSMDDKLDLLFKDYSPSSWDSQFTGDQNDLTLRHLMTHLSGLDYESSPSPETEYPSDYQTRLNPYYVLKIDMISVPGTNFKYSNVNFEAVMYMVMYMKYPGFLNSFQPAQYASFEDYLFALDHAVRALYYNYVQTNIFAPLGIVATCMSEYTDEDDYACWRYKEANDSTGVGIGFYNVCASNGWVLSSEGFIKFLQGWNNPANSSNLLSLESFSKINNFTAGRLEALGWTSNRNPDNGVKGLGHNGDWSADGKGGHKIKTGMMVTGDNTYMIILTNSHLTGLQSREKYMLEAYDKAICAPDIVLTGGNVRNLNSASLSIETDGVLNINSNEERVFKSGEKISLKPGFRALPGSKFRAYIGDCNSLPSFKTSSPPSTETEISEGSQLPDPAEKPLWVKIFPNPNAGKFQLSLDERINPDEAWISVYNAIGKMVLVIDDLRSNQVLFDLGDMPKGLYFITVDLPQNVRLNTRVLLK